MSSAGDTVRTISTPAPARSCPSPGSRDLKVPRADFARVTSFPRRVCEALVIVGLAILLVATWFVRAYTIDSNSMAETLTGPHAEIACDDCGWRFAAGIEGAASAGRPVVCPNCGASDMRLSLADTVAGDDVLVDRSAFQFRSPRRWEVVSFHSPKMASQLYVKRIVGLPGEHVRIVDGDVYIDGEIARKNLAQQRTMAIVVHDDRYRPQSADRRSCWRANADSRWNDLSGRWQCRVANETEGTASAKSASANHAEDGEADDGEASMGRLERALRFNSAANATALDWLTYHHCRRNGSTGQLEESPVVDVSGFNQTYPLGDTHVVRDLLLSLRSDGRGRGHAVLAGGRRRARIRLCHHGGWPRRAVQSRKDHRTDRQPTATVRHRAQDRAIADRRGGGPGHGRPDAVGASFSCTEPEAATTACPFAMATDGLSLGIEDLRILRDVYYGPPLSSGIASAPPQSLELAEDDFFVLSDNSPLGLDSRYASFGPTVAANLLVGKPFLGYGKRVVRAAFGPAIQVPNLGEIRYIR